MLRRSFLSSLAKSVAGLYLAPDALELLLEPRRKLWPGWTPALGHGHYVRLWVNEQRWTDMTTKSGKTHAWNLPPSANLAIVRGFNEDVRITFHFRPD